MKMVQGELDLTQDASDMGSNDSYSIRNGEAIHSLRVGDFSLESRIDADPVHMDDPKGFWWKSYLQGARPRSSNNTSSRLHVADLFCGPGGLALGVRQLAGEMGVELISEIAIDTDEEVTRVYAANHGARSTSTESVGALVDFRITGTASSAKFSYTPELIATDWLGSSTPEVDLVLAGPPCQGHSNLNNHSRGDDRRNALYMTVPAFAVAVEASIVIIENVPNVVHDSSRVVETTKQLFHSAGYDVKTGFLSASAMGWAQHRQRHFMIARLDRSPLPLDVVAGALADPVSRSAWWAIEDLEDVESLDVMDQVTELSIENESRVDWLFDNNEHDLALSERPLSHRDGTTYTSVYGRIKKDEPAQTLTTGFMSPGRGRYVHPTQRRVLTAREAARLQAFPDTYRFVVDPSNPPTRQKLAKWIGDAVPMPLGYGAALAALAPGSST